MTDPVQTAATAVKTAVQSGATAAVATVTKDASAVAATAQKDVAAVEKDATSYFAKVKAAWAKLTVPEKVLTGAGLAALLAAAGYVVSLVV
jgi:hypothetical protein